MAQPPISGVALGILAGGYTVGAYDAGGYDEQATNLELGAQLTSRRPQRGRLVCGSLQRGKLQ